MESQTKVVQGETENQPTQDLGKYGPERVKVGTPKYLGFQITAANRNKLIRKYGRDEVLKQQKMYRAFLKGKKTFVFQNMVHPVMTTDRIKNSEKYEPQINNEEE